MHYSTAAGGNARRIFMEDVERAELIEIIKRLTPEQTALVISRMRELLGVEQPTQEARFNGSKGGAA